MSTGKKASKSNLSTWSIDLLSGALAAICAKTASAPPERVKLLLQTRINEFSGQKGTGVFLRIIREQGVFSFWRGNFPSILRYFPQQACMLTFREEFKRQLNENEWGRRHGKTVNFLAGAGAGVTALSIVYPLDVARTRLAADISKSGAPREFTGLRNVFSKLSTEFGYRSLYSGYTSAFSCYFIYRGIQIGGYDTARTHFGLNLKQKTKIDSFSNFIKTFGVSYGFTCLAASCAYPLDTIRRRCMMISKEDPHISMRAAVESVRVVHGYRGLYRGLVVNYVRGLGSSLVLVGFDYIRPLIDQLYSRVFVGSLEDEDGVEIAV